MGYSVSIRAKNEKELLRMERFMQEEYRSWAVLSGKNGHPHASNPTRDLSYDKGRLAFGFDYQSGLHGWEREWTYCLTRWMALRAGQRRRKFKKEVVDPNSFAEPVPFMVYDGYEFWPLLVKTDSEAKKLPKKQQWCAVDLLGMKSGPSKYDEASRVAVEQSLGGDFQQEMWDELSKLGPRPADEAELTKFTALRDEIVMKYMKPSMDENLELARNELTRLSRLFENF